MEYRTKCGCIIVESPPNYSINCRYYILGGRCGSVDAPNPSHSLCIGVKGCGSFVGLNKDALIDFYEALNQITAIERTDVPYDKYDVLNAINIAKQALAKEEGK